MYDHDDPSSPFSQPSLDNPSSDRPPQFNWRNCGYDCGEGCEKASEDEGNGGVSDEETAVDADEDQNSMTGPQDGSLRMGQDTDDAITDSSDLDLTDCVDTAVYGQPPGGYTTMSASLIVEPCVTAENSPTASTGGSARSRSPDPGVLYWITSMPIATPLPLEYHFLQTPLRLSPQYEHCRGDPASHLVVPDHSPLWYLMEQSWNGYVSPP